MKQLQAVCPICDGKVSIPEGTEVSEILTCDECNNWIVVKKITKDSVRLDKAPKVEEDWGE